MADLAGLLVSSGVLVIDPSGRRWCMVGRHGFTRVNGVWWWGSPAGLVCEVSTATTVETLDTWCTARPDWFTPDDHNMPPAPAGRPL